MDANGGRHAHGSRSGRLIAASDVLAKALLALFLALVVIDPTWGNLEGKAPVARALTYPALAFAIPLWHAFGARKRPYPWTADLLLTLTGFSDVLGNRLDLYDQVTWFDDWMHFMNVGLIAGAVLLLTVPVTAGLLPHAERALAAGMTAALAWELFEFRSFVTRSDEYQWAYADTLGDLALGWLGAAFAAAWVHASRRRSLTHTHAIWLPSQSGRYSIR